ncbi:MAG TPA: protein kinase [Thermomicrobiales bacterium]|nr:protein kinase [Thermomicrobiales bacterium]
MSGFANSLIGLTLGGYSIRRMIARGGMGIVYEGTQESLGRRVAVKVLYPHLGEDESFRDRFQREARAIAQLRHPNIVGVIDFGADQGFFFMAMDLIDGPSLRDELTRRHAQSKPFSTEDSLIIIGKVAAALSYAHNRGFVHRDVKPANVMLDSSGDVFLTDFGLVKLADSQNVTVAGMIVGTPEYMAPEQSAGVADVTPAADQYSLAILSYQLLVGRVPFTAPTPVGVIQKHITEPPPPPHTIIPTFPADVERVLMRGLAKEPSERYPSVDTFFRELQDVSLATLPAAAVIPTTAPDPGVAGATPAAVVTTPTGQPAEPSQVTEATLPQHDPDQVTASTPLLAASAAGLAASVVSSTGAVVADAQAPPPVGDASSGGYGPPSTAVPVRGDAAGRSRVPLVAAVVALALMLLVGGIAVASIFGGGDDPEDPAAAAATTTSEAAGTQTADAEATNAVVLVEATPTDVAVEQDTPTATATLEPTPTERPTQPPSQLTPTQTRRVIPSPTPFVINPITPTPSPTPVLLGDIPGPAAEVELRNYMSVPTWIELVGVGSFVAQPNEYVWRAVPAGTWSYVQRADGYLPLEGQITWEEGGSYFWEFYDNAEVEIVEIQNNLEVPMTLEFDGWGEMWVDARSTSTRAFPAGVYEYSFRAEGYNDFTSTVTMDAGARTTWPFNPS